jgi:hypothetical protein
MRVLAVLTILATLGVGAAAFLAYQRGLFDDALGRNQPETRPARRPAPAPTPVASVEPTPTPSAPASVPAPAVAPTPPVPTPASAAAVVPAPAVAPAPAVVPTPPPTQPAASHMTTKKPPRRTKPVPKEVAAVQPTPSLPAPAPTPTPVATTPPPTPVAPPVTTPVPPPTPMVPPPPPVPVAPKPGSLDAVASVFSVKVDGPLPDSEIRSTVERALGSFRDCYRAAAKQANKTPALRVKLTFTIDEGRAARDMNVSGDTLGLGGCMRDAAAKIRTRVAPDVGTASVSVVAKFQPTDG